MIEFESVYFDDLSLCLLPCLLLPFEECDFAIQLCYPVYFLALQNELFRHYEKITALKVSLGRKLTY